MILLDAIYINLGGGKVLLDYLVDELEKTNNEVFYLFDERIRDNHSYIKKSNTVLYLNSEFLLRYKFYKKNKFAFKKVLCFGNIPPPIKVEAEVYTYFHNTIYLEIPKSFSKIQNFKYKLKIKILNCLKNNSDFWIVQTEFIRKEFNKKFKFASNKILVIPFYPLLKISSSNGNVVRDKYSYLYVSNATQNKNHLNLIEAFCLFYDQHNKGKLTLTVNEDYPLVKNIIQKKISMGYPIINVGFVSRNELRDLYNKSEYLIYPSISESFGLGIIEGIEHGCKIIGADLPYTYAVCEPSAVFNPFDIQDIIRVFRSISQNRVLESKQLVFNKIDELTAFLIK